jgi:crotonobetainyl-CoA:carnitine CoA-transferase CaiB-like acyl-CoA transferase
MPPLPLEGIRVIDLTVVWAGPFGAALLSDLGAEVIRVESVQRWDTNLRIAGNPDQMRQNGGNPAPDAAPWETSGNFNSVGRNRKSVTIDLTRPEGQAAFYRLVERSDVFIENNSPDVVHHLKINYDVLKEHNPKLIMVSLAAFGATGPYRHFRAYGANMEAVVGHALLRGYADADPTHNTNVFFADACAGATSAFAVMAALHHRLRTGEGQYIDMAQAENVAHTFSQAIMDYSMNRRVQSTLGNRDAARAPQGVYRCDGDDKWLALSCGSDAEFRALCDVIGRPELATDARFAGSLSRHREQDALDAEITAWTVTVDQYEAFHKLQAAGVPASPVLSIAQVYADPHLRERGMWQQVTHPVAGTHDYLKPPISHMSKTPLQYWRHAPTLGMDNEYVYKEVMGYSDDEYRWFVENQHAGTTFINVRPGQAARQFVPPAPATGSPGQAT